MNNKIAIIYCLVDRAINLSHRSFHKQNIRFIEDVLRHNNYPPDLIKLHIKKRLRKIYSTTDTTHNNTSDNKTFICLPFIKELEGFMKNFFKRLNTSVVFSMNNKLNSIIVLGKDKNLKLNNSNVIYKINCDNCNASYVGQTCRRLGVRIKEHQRKYREEDKNSSLFIHKTENNHTINFHNVKILDTEINTGKRLFTEALYIHTQKNFMNKQFEITKLPKEYSILINNFEFLSS